MKNKTVNGKQKDTCQKRYFVLLFVATINGVNLRGKRNPTYTYVHWKSPSLSYNNGKSFGIPR